MTADELQTSLLRFVLKMDKQVATDEEQRAVQDEAPDAACAAEEPPTGPAKRSVYHFNGDKVHPWWRMQDEKWKLFVENVFGTTIQDVMLAHEVSESTDDVGQVLVCKLCQRTIIADNWNLLRHLQSKNHFKSMTDAQRDFPRELKTQLPRLKTSRTSSEDLSTFVHQTQWQNLNTKRSSPHCWRSSCLNSGIPGRSWHSEGVWHVLHM